MNIIVRKAFRRRGIRQPTDRPRCVHCRRTKMGRASPTPTGQVRVPQGGKLQVQRLQFERRLRLCDPEVATANSSWELTVGSSSKEKLPLHGSGVSHGLTTASPTTEKSLTLRDTIVRLCWRAVAASRASMTERGRPFICAWARTKPQRSEID